MVPVTLKGAVHPTFFLNLQCDALSFQEFTAKEKENITTAKQGVILQDSCQLRVLKQRFVSQET